MKLYVTDPNPGPFEYPDDPQVIRVYFSKRAAKKESADGRVFLLELKTKEIKP